MSPASNQIPQNQAVDVWEARGLRRLAQVFEGATDRNDIRIEGRGRRVRAA